MVVVGHSIGAGVGATDTVYGGAALPGGIVLRDGGSTLTAWPSSGGAAPDPGVLPYLAASMQSGTIIRRATPGQIVAGIETTELPGTLADCTALGIDRASVGLVIIMIGENDAQTGVESAAYTTRLPQTLDAIERAYPNARVVLQDMVTEDASYSEFAAIRAANVAAVALRSSRSLASRAGIGLHDTVHYSLAGYATAAAAQWAGWLATS